MDLALNNLQRLICHKTKQTKPNLKLENIKMEKNVRRTKLYGFYNLLFPGY